MKVEPGKRFGMLTAIATAGRATDNHQIWELRCDCGQVCRRTSNNLHAGRPHSCGCVKPKPNLTHGGRGTREYRQWQGAKARCHAPGNKDYSRYGARGIAMCEEWRNDFAAFIAYMGPCPAGLTLDRIDVNGGYAPGNCRWATDSQQQRNKRTSFRVEIAGREFDSLTAAAEGFGVSITTINRWCEGFDDARRGTHTPPRQDCKKEPRHA